MASGPDLHGTCASWSCCEYFLCALRSVDHRAEASAPVTAGRTMKTRSMAAAEAQQSNSATHSQLSSEHTSKPTADASAQQPVLHAEEQSSGKAGGKQKGKSGSKPGKTKASKEREEVAARNEVQEASDAAVSSELSDQTTVELGEEVLLCHKGRPA